MTGEELQSADDFLSTPMLFDNDVDVPLLDGTEGYEEHDDDNDFGGFNGGDSWQDTPISQDFGFSKLIKIFEDVNINSFLFF